jgi:hypothetical protein
VVEVFVFLGVFHSSSVHLRSRKTARARSEELVLCPSFFVFELETHPSFGIIGEEVGARSTPEFLYRR